MSVCRTSSAITASARVPDPPTLAAHLPWIDPNQSRMIVSSVTILPTTILGGADHADREDPSRRLSLRRRQGHRRILQEGPQYGPARRHRRGPRALDQGRSEERRVGKECRSRWSPY